MNAVAPEGGVNEEVPRARHWLTATGVAVILITLVPPVETLAQRYVLAETVQFVVYAMIAPGLFVLGAPWRALRLSRADPQAAPNPPGGPVDRMAISRQQHGSFRRAALFLLAFMGVTLAWRLPPTMDALVTHPSLVVVELVSLLPVGTGLWLELLPSPPLRPRLPRPQRAGTAALAMWFIWVIAYVIGMNIGGVFGAYGDVPGRALSLLADQELAAGAMLVVAGLSFMPVVFTALLGWLKDSNSTEELQRMARDEHERAVVRGWGWPQSGPKAPSA